MCCLFTTLVLIGPRAAIFVWWLVDPVRWAVAFDSFLWPLVGFLLLPWTTLMYLIVVPGGVTGLDWLWIAIAFVLDLATWGGGGYGNRDRIPGSVV